MVVASVALFVSLAGVSVAGGVLLGTQIKDHTISASKLTHNAVRFLRGKKGLRGPAGTPGVQGVQGVPGPQGAQGPAGTFNPAKVTQVKSDTVTVPGGGGITTVSVDCPTGTVLTGGGAVTTSLSLWASRPSGNGWFAGATAYSSNTEGTLYATAICAA
jgi:hypothetical protein